MLVIANKPGQLGNRLFQFAQFVACAMEHNLSLSNPSFDEYADYFETTSRDLFCRFPERASLLKGRPAARRLFYRLCYYTARVLVRGGFRRGRVRAVYLDWEEWLELCGAEFLSTLGPRSLVFMQGWHFEAAASLARRAPEVREFFRPLDRFSANVDALERRAREGADVLVGVHIRHGDYRTFQGGRYFYELDVYTDLMRRAEALFAGRRVRFLVCSNAEHDTQALAPFSHVNGSGHLVEDLYALARCDYLLGPPSTYTMWASYYGATPLYKVEDPSHAPRLEDFAVYGVDGVPHASPDELQASPSSALPPSRS